MDGSTCTEGAGLPARNRPPESGCPAHRHPEPCGPVRRFRRPPPVGSNDRARLRTNRSIRQSPDPQPFGRSLRVSTMHRFVLRSSGYCPTFREGYHPAIRQVEALNEGWPSNHRRRHRRVEAPPESRRIYRAANARCNQGRSFRGEWVAADRRNDQSQATASGTFPSVRPPMTSLRNLTIRRTVP